MRPQKLNVSAFGPFAGEVAVDFSAFTGNELSSLAVPTGLGSPGQLLALCFTLVGVESGARYQTCGPRSPVHAASDVRSDLCLRSALGDQTSRVSRTAVRERL